MYHFDIQNSFLIDILNVTQYFILFYFLWLNALYLILLVFAIKSAYEGFQESEVEDIERIVRSDSLPTITFIIPAYNEEMTIEQSIRTLLQISYRYKQIIVVNDGSTDLTLDVLRHAFALIKIPAASLGTIKTHPIKAFYQSRDYANLLVVDKVNGGSKADALNAGINVCTSPIFVVMDSDTLIDDRQFTLLIRPFLIDSRTIVAGASVRVVNGCTVENNRIVKFGFPSNFLAGIQCIEYLRAFFLGRLGWSWTRGNLIVSGAFGLFNTEKVVKAGGFDDYSLGEDMEIIMRLHRKGHERHEDYKIAFMPNPVAWTEAPEDWHSLASQRERWHRGLIQTLKKHQKMFLNPSYGLEGLVTVPFFVLGELMAPIIELIGYVILLISYWFNLINLNFFWLFIGISWGFTTILSFTTIILEELTFNRYPSFKQMMQMLVFAILENFGYRQMTVFWRVKAFFKPKKGGRKWIDLKRRGFKLDE
jgi:cellulose synthase/poly-beta-1,6-N-acetylglucosamine synthase-like glycosyltransferase